MTWGRWDSPVFVNIAARRRAVRFRLDVRAGNVVTSIVWWRKGWGGQS